jgi:hypothetical protein
MTKYINKKSKSEIEEYFDSIKDDPETKGKILKWAKSEIAQYQELIKLIKKHDYSKK